MVIPAKANKLVLSYLILLFVLTFTKWYVLLSFFSIPYGKLINLNIQPYIIYDGKNVSLIFDANW